MSRRRDSLETMLPFRGPRKGTEGEELEAKGGWLGWERGRGGGICRYPCLEQPLEFMGRTTTCFTTAFDREPRARVQELLVCASRNGTPGPVWAAILHSD